MREFVEKHASLVCGTLSCFDRLLFRGNLPLHTPGQMLGYLRSKGVEPKDFKAFATSQTERLLAHGRELVEKAGRPFQYINGHLRKDDWALQIAQRDGITDGLVAMCSVLEPCTTFSAPHKKGQATTIHKARTKCLHCYFYFMDPQFGLIHVKVQTWFPFRTQVYANGHEWLARQMSQAGIAHTKLDNAFPWIEDLPRAQQLADNLASFKWKAWLNRYARLVNPLLGDTLKSLKFWWVSAQAEYSTDILFHRPKDLQLLAPRLMEHAALTFGAADVMSFFGRKSTPRFTGEVTSDFKSFLLDAGRQMGWRVKHRLKDNWLKMYDKGGCLLRIETVINNPAEFRVQRHVQRRGRRTLAWVPMPKSVAFLPSYQRVSLASNARYLTALSEVDNPTDATKALEAATRRKKTRDGHGVRALNPLSKADSQLFHAVLDGAHAVRGFSNKDIRDALAKRGYRLAEEPHRASSHVTRLLRTLRAHGLIARIPRSRRWRLSSHGTRVMGTSIQLRDIAFPVRYRAA